MPDMIPLLLVLLVSLILTGIGILVFKKLKKGFAEEVWWLLWFYTIII